MTISNDESDGGSASNAADSGLAHVTPSHASEDTVSLRGAKVDVDMRKAGRVVAVLGIVGLLALVIALFVAAEQRNSQINELQHHGVPVQVTVSGCLGLMGGSGSNAAGDVCRGAFTYNDHRYLVIIPGSSLHAPGEVLHGVVAAGDPSVFSTQLIVSTERSSGRVYILPTVLLLVAVLGAVALIVGRRRRHGGGVSS